MIQYADDTTLCFQSRASLEVECFGGECPMIVVHQLCVRRSLRKNVLGHLCSEKVSRILSNSYSKNGLLWPCVPTRVLWHNVVGRMRKHPLPKVLCPAEESNPNHLENRNERILEHFESLDLLTLPSLYMYETVLYCFYKCEVTRGRDVYDYNTRGRDALRPAQHRLRAFEALPSEVGA
ncbi:hypothetical protein J6590_089014 [Homalodisca vitripennis]|nr:hypothetical protein J6590_089014 [Homalodisca vitripennis]